jgi:hypothetical protein
MVVFLVWANIMSTVPLGDIHPSSSMMDSCPILYRPIFRCHAYKGLLGHLFLEEQLLPLRVYSSKIERGYRYISSSLFMLCLGTAII